MLSRRTTIFLLGLVILFSIVGVNMWNQWEWTVTWKDNGYVSWIGEGQFAITTTSHGVLNFTASQLPVASSLGFRVELVDHNNGIIHLVVL